MIKYIQREMSRVKDYPQEVVDFMSKESSWVLVDPDSLLGECAILSYPEIIFVLDLDKAEDSVLEFFSTTSNEKRHNDIIKQFAEDTSLLEHDIEEFIEDDLNTNCVFAYIYPDDGTDESIYNDDKFEDRNHCFIFNGLLEDEDYDHEEFGAKAINVSGYEII